jgi:hypothetical protein
MRGWEDGKVERKKLRRWEDEKMRKWGKSKDGGWGSRKVERKKLGK